MAGFDTEFYTTAEEIIDLGGMDYSGTGSATLDVEVIETVDDRVNVVLTARDFSDNVDTVWFIRYNGLVADLEQQVYSAFVEYLEEGNIIGSYKIAKENVGIEYIDGGSSFNPKYDALQSYDTTYGGDIVVMVILDTDGKMNIHSYYIAGRKSATVL